MGPSIWRLCFNESVSSFAAPWKKSAYIDDPFESFSVPDIFERMLIVGAGVVELLPAFDVPVANSRGVAVIVFVVLKDAVRVMEPPRRLGRIVLSNLIFDDRN
jgi:hypothetical protein